MAVCQKWGNTKTSIFFKKEKERSKNGCALRFYLKKIFLKRTFN